MQTFLTSKDFRQSASYLDNKRLNNQLNESRVILAALAKKANGETKVAWSNHPAAKMWEGYEDFFMQYNLAHAYEAQERGIKIDVNWDAIVNIYEESFASMFRGIFYPPWYADQIQLDKVITTHQANLYRKDPEYYADWKWISDWLHDNESWSVCCPARNKKNGVWVKRCDYFWPTHMEAS